jgi:hypothetical protein
VKNPARNPALDNFSTERHAILSRLGLNCVVVVFDTSPSSLLWQQADSKVEESLDAELLAAGAGQHDSSLHGDGRAWHFFCALHLGKATRLLKESIERRGLLSITQILHFESDSSLRVWYPPTAELIESSV